MDKAGCEAVLERMKKKRDYFNSIDFPLIASEFQKAVECIEYLMEDKVEDKVKDKDNI